MDRIDRLKELIKSGQYTLREIGEILEPEKKLSRQRVKQLIKDHLLTESRNQARTQYKQSNKKTVVGERTRVIRGAIDFLSQLGYVFNPTNTEINGFPVKFHILKKAYKDMFHTNLDEFTGVRVFLFPEFDTLIMSRTNSKSIFFKKEDVKFTKLLELK